jgi:hypothetical protein
MDDNELTCTPPLLPLLPPLPLERRVRNGALEGRLPPPPEEDPCCLWAVRR